MPEPNAESGQFALWVGDNFIKVRVTALTMEYSGGLRHQGDPRSPGAKGSDATLSAITTSPNLAIDIEPAFKKDVDVVRRTPYRSGTVFLRSKSVNVMPTTLTVDTDGAGEDAADGAATVKKVT